MFQRVLQVGMVTSIAIGSITGAASADSVHFTNGAGNDGSLGSFVGEITYETEFDSDLGAFVGMLAVEIENTSNPANGGYITAIAFNVPRLTDDTPSGSLLDSTDPDFGFISHWTPGTSTDAQPFGVAYDMGASVTNQWSGGGSPTGGIAVGETATFTFRIISDDVLSMSARDFLDFDRSPWDDRLDWQHNFVVRMRGFLNGGSDKLEGRVVPVPAPIALGLAGLAVAGFARRKIARNA